MKLRKLLAVFVLTRAVAIGATHLGALAMTPQKAAEWKWIPDRDLRFAGPPPPAFLAPLVRWDANFYVSIARAGYPPPEPGPNHHLVFFPEYPLLVRALGFLDTFWAAFLVSNLCCLIAALCMFKLAGFEAAALFLCAPGSHFLSYPYSEALFAAGLAACLLLIREEKFLAAGVAGAVASGARSPGVAAFVALAAARKPLAALVSLGGILAYMAWCSSAQHDALAFVHLQAFHGRHVSLLGPFKAFLAFDNDPDYYVASLLALYVAFRLVRRTPAWQWLSALFLVLLPLSTGTLAAMIRYQSANVPLIAGVPALVQGRKLWLVCGACLAWMAFEAFLYGKGIGHF